MTKEEILDYFKDINFMYNNPSMFDTLKRMLYELTEPCEDAVSREAVVNSIRKYWHNEYYQRTSIQDERECLIKDVIQALPSVQPEREKGEWQAVDGAWACSKCGCNSNNDGAFCQWCGADMRGGEMNERNNAGNKSVYRKPGNTAERPCRKDGL